MVTTNIIIIAFSKYSFQSDPNQSIENHFISCLINFPVERNELDSILMIVTDNFMFFSSENDIHNSQRNKIPMKLNRNRFIIEKFPFR